MSGHRSGSGPGHGVEVPAGTIPAGEEPERAALRAAREKTGLETRGGLRNLRLDRGIGRSGPRSGIEPQISVRCSRVAASSRDALHCSAALRMPSYSMSVRTVLTGFPIPAGIPARRR
ncbi:NUDIX domain-containing protein [Enemella evansiae]|uniref:NUDIX domain-containing protein n=1 Tax=Enemella evansiae TaxID=2016499 RepID=UPI0038996352